MRKTNKKGQSLSIVNKLGLNFKILIILIHHMA